MHAVVAQFKQSGVPQDSDMPLARMSAIVQVNHTGSPKLHVLINTKIKFLNKLNLVKYYEVNMTVRGPGTKDM